MTDQPVRRTAATITPEALDQLYAERDMHGREADRLRKDWVTMRARAEQAEAAITASVRSPPGSPPTTPASTTTTASSPPSTSPRSPALQPSTSATARTPKTPLATARTAADGAFPVIVDTGCHAAVASVVDRCS